MNGQHPRTLSVEWAAMTQTVPLRLSHSDLRSCMVAASLRLRLPTQLAGLLQYNCEQKGGPRAQYTGSAKQ